MHNALTQSNERRSASDQFWRRLIFGAAHEAKRTRDGIPTDEAILARWWLTDHRPSRSCKDEWERSFECACEMLGRDARTLRAELTTKVDASLKHAAELHINSAIYSRRAMVLTCAGVPTAISRQFLLPLVDEQSYEDVAGVDHGDQFIMYDRCELAEVG